jgi:response regulator RpfG family c-di-GMP phosphodiesterase
MTEVPKNQRTVLLVDDDANIINALNRTLRRDGYTILTANCGEEGLALLENNEVGVIISDHRLPHMTGVEFLRKVKIFYPKTLRVILTGYTELESVTCAINEGAIYKFLTKPWDDDLLRNNIREAFQYYEMEQENIRLTQELKLINDKLSIRNQNLELTVADKTREILHSINALQISLEILEQLPIGVIGIDEQNMIVASNLCADELCSQPQGSLLGLMAEDALPKALLKLLPGSYSNNDILHDGGIVTLTEDLSMHVLISTMGNSSFSKGVIMLLSPLKKS